MKKVTLVKSLIGAKPNQKATAKSLGLCKIGDSITHEDNAVLAGISNIRAKCLRSSNPTNVVKATFEALKALRTAEEVAALRGLSVEDIKA